MPCYHPLRAYRSKTVNSDTGKRNIVFNIREAIDDGTLSISCGQCIGCRLERSRQWAIRCTHEASLYDNNCFITLTYNDEHLPPNGTLVKEHFQKFMKRLRRAYPNERVRYYMCGEYGERFQRPHYHACLFNFDFRDKEYFKRSPSGEKLYVSQSLDRLWSDPCSKKLLGFTSIGNVTFDSAAYVARYVTKKVTGEKSFHHYNEIDYSTGEILSSRIPEYNCMSRRPGIAKEWFTKYLTDVYPGDFVVLRDKKLRPPKYYDSQYELLYPTEMEELKYQRTRNAAKHSANNTLDRRLVREEIQLHKHKLLIRGYENGD